MSLEVLQSSHSPKPETPQGFSVREVRVAGNRATCGGVESALLAVDLVMKAVPQDINVWTNNNPVNFPKAFAQYGDRLRIVNKDMSEVPDESVFIVSAHGAPPPTFQEAADKGLFVVDTTCPYVSDAQEKVIEAEADGVHSVFIGEAKHPETIGVKGQVDEEHITIFDPTQETEGLSIPDNSRVFAKTTNDPEETNKAIRQLQKINPTIDASKAHSCYALKNRFLSGKQAVKQADFWLLVGDPSSHNARGLTHIGASRKIPAALVRGPEDIDWSWFGPSIEIVSASGAASVPEKFIQEVIAPFRILGIPIIELPKAVKESYRRFKLPTSQIEAVRQQFA